MFEFHDLGDGSRRSRKALYVVAATYISIGLLLSLSAAVAGDRLSTFLGFLIITGAITALGVFNQLLRLGVRAKAISAGIDDVQRRLRALELAREEERRTKAAEIVPAVPAEGTGQPALAAGEEVGSGEEGAESPEAIAEPELNVESEDGEDEAHEASLAEVAALLNLAEIGSGDPAGLAAAVLNRDRFPRLVRLLEEEPPARSAAETAVAQLRLAEGGTVGGEHVRPAGTATVDESPMPLAGGSTAPASGSRNSEDKGDASDQWGPESSDDFEDDARMTTRNLLGEWKHAIREGDLATCRRVYSAIVDLSEPGAAEPLREMLERLADQTETRLRRTFADCIRRRDFSRALVLGQQFVELLPDRPVREEFERLRPALESRVNGAAQGVAAVAGQAN
ncbi:MAG: hypothetical protein J5J06_12135 [Phycisphaerae bacterium]|nr:hypothetical protein [Phycisphaerae bacterium]